MVDRLGEFWGVACAPRTHVRAGCWRSFCLALPNDTPTQSGTTGLPRRRELIASARWTRGCSGDWTPAFRPAAFVAIVGPSGSGKSTLGELLVGLVAPNEGVVTVDGRSPDARRGSVAYLSPMEAVFTGSIEENVTLFERPPDRARLTASCRKSGLDAVVAALPMGLSTRLGAGGDGLSTGQLQRVLLARTFYRDADFVLI